MALTIVERPNNVVFAENPIVIKAHTSLTAKTFLRIIADVAVVVNNPSGAYTHTESYTYSVTGDGNAAFNISETVQAALRTHAVVEIVDDTVRQKPAVATYDVTLREVYLDKMIEVEGEVNNSITGMTAIMGGLSDYERLVHPAWNAETFVGTGTVLSRKPDNEVVYGPHPILIPVISGTQQDMHVQIASLPSGSTTEYGGTAAATAWVPQSVRIDTQQMTDGVYQFKLTPSVREYVTRKLIRASAVNEHASFLFLNGFGILESITCLTRKIPGYKIKADYYMEGKRIDQPVTNIVNLGGTPTIQIQLTTGLIDRVWADWFASEFFPSRRVWMLFNGKYLPVAVESDDDIKLYDESRPGICEIKFTARCACRGSVTSTVR